MVLSSTLKSVKAALSDQPQSIGEIMQKVDFTRGAIKESLEILVELNEVEVVLCGRPSGKKCGWVRKEYRLLSK